MAENILKLRVDSQEYDNKIKRAAEGLQRYADGCRKAGGTLTQLDDGVLEFTRALGQMETVSKSAKGSVAELTKTFTNLSVVYNKLTDEEKNAPFGQALKGSLDELKGRIQSGNAELKNIGQSLNETGGFMDGLTSKLTVNIDALKLFNVGLTAAKAALGVAKDAFFASEANVDEWGRTMQSAQSLYEGFVTSLNNSNFSGFLSNIDEIVKAAREAYNELDKLGTMKTIQSPQFSKQEAENNRLRTMLMTGRYIAPGAGSGMVAAPGMKTGDLLSPAQIKRIEGMLQNGMNTIVSLTKNELGQTGKAIDAYYNSLARQNGMSLKEFRAGTSSWSAFSQKMQGYDQYQKWRSENYYTDNWGNRRVKEGNPYQEYAKWGTFRVDKMGENSYNDLVNLIKQQQQQQGQMYSTLGQAYRTINRAEGITVKGLMGGGGRSGGGIKNTTDPTDRIQQQFDTAMAKANIAAEELKFPDLTGPSEAWETFRSAIVKGSEEIGDSMNFTKWTENFDPYTEKMNEMTKALKQQQMAFSMSAQAAANFGSALSSLDDPGAKAAGTVIAAIANIALGFGTAAAQASSMGPWGWIAYVAAGLGALATAISTVHSLTGYAEGGMIKGNSYSGDNLMAMGPSGLIGLNAGEVVLNASQQSALAQNLQSSGNRPIRIYGKLSGTDILLSADRTLKTQGKQLAVWNG